MKTSDNRIRVLTAVPICDGHDSAVNTINLELVRHGIEVVYLGYHRSVRDIVRAAVQDDVRAVGISSYNGGHVEFFTEVVRGLRRTGAGHIGVFGGGGGTITREDATRMHARGVDRVFFAGTALSEIVQYVSDRFSEPVSSSQGKRGSWDRRISALLAGGGGRIAKRPTRGSGPLVIGVAGPGGAGKTTLIDELALRFLRTFPNSRLAILAHDPSGAGQGALLGDRAAMIHAQNDRVFMRSVATRGQPGGLSALTPRFLRVLRNVVPEAFSPGRLSAGGRASRRAPDFAAESARQKPRPPDQRGFDLVLVETVGIGQESVPFANRMVDRTVLVMSPDYGSRLQLQKIAMFEKADVVVVNKSDRPGARAAAAEIGQRLGDDGRQPRIVSTIATRHRDAGVDELFSLLTSNATFSRRDHARSGRAVDRGQVAC